MSQDLNSKHSKKLVGVNPLRAWLSEFLLVRGLFKGPTKQPLYSYQVTGDEYRALRRLLEATSAKAFDPLNGKTWAALFCLFTAEWFRREYDASDSGWSWNGVQDQINVSFTQSERTDLVMAGLERYWQRPIHYRQNGRDLLGSLFSEGGLPWLLVQSDTHGFARVVRFGLKHFYNTYGNSRSTVDMMSDCEHYLPQAFRNAETRYLLAGIVEQLMSLVKKYPLRDVDDPANYLDKHAEHWRKSFPIPLDEANARGLINDWLRDAGKQRQQRKDQAHCLHPFTCTHLLLGVLPDWRIETRVSLPSQAQLDISAKELPTTRMQLVIYEGESLLARGTVIYGRVTDDRVDVLFTNREMKLKRQLPEEPLNLRLLANGHVVQTFYFEEGELEFNDSPLIFEERGDERYFIASASCRLEGGVAYIRLPYHYKLQDGSEGISFGEDAHGGQWVRVENDTRLSNGSDLVSVCLNQNVVDDLKPYLSGQAALYTSSPGTVYIGFPSLEFPDGSQKNHTNTRQYMNDEHLAPRSLDGFAGVVRYAVKSASGDTLLRRLFGVLPEGFRISVFPESAKKPARIVLNKSNLSANVANGDIHAKHLELSDSLVIHVRSIGSETPKQLFLDISSEHGISPVRLMLPYPEIGARLLGSDGAPLDKDRLMLGELLGTQLLLVSNKTQGQLFIITLELEAYSGKRLQRHYEVKVSQLPHVIDLFSFQPDMVQLMGAVSSQDAFIKLIVESDRRLLDVKIDRYHGCVHEDGAGRVKITDGRPDGSILDADVEAMLVSDPKKEPVRLPQVVSQGVETGWHEIPNEINYKGPWIIYPASGSSSQFRPYLYASPEVDDQVLELKVVQTLHTAAKIFDAEHRRALLNGIVEEMAIDFDHTGWQYLSDLKRNYAHLPLSAFEPWLAVSRNTKALAAVVFRLDNLDSFFCQRLQDELAIIWDCILVSAWVSANDQMHRWLASKGILQELQISIAQSRQMLLKDIASGYECIKNYLERSNASGMRSPPLEAVLPVWYQDLRRSHESNSHWPTDLGDALSDWVKRQSLPAAVTNLSSVHFSDAATYLPIFMAHVTAGVASLEDLPYGKAYKTFAIKMISDFDRDTWYRSVHAAVLSYLVSRNQ